MNSDQKTPYDLFMLVYAVGNIHFLSCLDIADSVSSLSVALINLTFSRVKLALFNAQ